MENLQRTALYDSHLAAKARMVPFAGWEMPVQYGGVIDEVRAVRENCGLFDVSHMGQLWVSGAHAATALDQIVSANWRDLPAGRVAYGLLLNEQGGIIDDVMGYHLENDCWLVVVNASRAEVDEAHLKAHLNGVTLHNSYASQAMIAIQGPNSEKVLQPLCNIDLSQVKWRDCVRCTLDRSEGVLARGGYTGCDGFEWMGDSESAPRIWQLLIENGAEPCGLGARDVLRMEAGLPLYGHELREEWTPLQSGVSFAVEKPAADAASSFSPDFIGKTALLGATADKRIKALQMESRAIARDGYAVLLDGAIVGEITSGTHSPTLGGGIALAMLPAEVAIGQQVEVQVRGSLHSARVVKKPFVEAGRKAG